MSTLSFEVGDGLLVALKATPLEAAAAVPLGRPQSSTSQRLADYGVSALSGTAEELEKDAEGA
jgi:hypothetical protein